MKKKFFIYGYLLFLLVFMFGCDDYDRVGVEKCIYVNQEALSMFVGDKSQLTASPSDDSFTWTSEDPTIATVSNDGLVEAKAEGSTNIIVNSGEIRLKVPVAAVVKVPLENVNLSETSIELFPGTKKTVIVSLIPSNANDVPKASWVSENSNVATVTAGGEITAIGDGSTNIVYKIGNIQKTVTVSVSLTRPFNGPHILSSASPCEILAADFDFGGEGNAFHDNDSGDNSGQGGNYRRQGGDTQSEAVDVEGFGQNVGWANPGEWLLFTVDVQTAGKYLLDVQTSVPGSGSFHLEVDGKNVTNTVEIPNTDGWGNFVWNPSPGIAMNLTAGKHKIKYYIEGGHNVRALRFTKN